LADYFIFNRPRDIVSGDFYWVASIQPHLIFSVGDCTGHGVPGAFMSMLGISALNDIIKSLGSCKAATILDLLRERIRESLHQTADLPATSSDGMDISICIYEPNTRELQFSGAHNPLYLIRDQEITIIPADKQDIGSRYHESQSFTNHQLKLETGDCLYLFSDGFPDQFGGPDFKKYKYKRFREFLISISRYPMDKQSELLGNELAQWMGHHPQIDDIIVMGVRV